MAAYKWDNLILFMEQLSTATKLKLPLDKTIASMSRESLDRRWAGAQQSVSELVRMGSPLAEAMDNYPQFFPGMVRRLIRVGEEGNILPKMLSSLSRYIQTAREIQHRLQKCMIYPLIIWTLLLLDIGILVTFVFPKFYEMFEATSGGGSNTILWFLGVGPSVLLIGEGLLLIVVWIVIGWLSADIEGRSTASSLSQRIVYYLPFIGSLQRHAKAAEACEVLGLLVDGGHNVRDAIQIAKLAMDNAPMHKALEEVDTALISGEPYEEVEASSLIPPTSLWMISETGGKPELGQALLGIAQYHRRQVDSLSSLIRELIEPLLLFSIAVMGGGTIIVFYTGLFQLGPSNLFF
ncbi:MAG: type II secretion system F family protein [Candidatus Omnitrophica bacterium]|nr:type II secretion system F family protein [Candidatus Omnitrophota bacterium]